MNLQVKLFIFTICVTSYIQANTIKWLYTAAILDHHFESRKQEYLHSLGTLYQFGFEPYIVEACKKTGPTFLDIHSKNVFYAQSNNPRLKNKGINEASTMLESLNYFDFNDEDIIIKITGRYYFSSDHLMKIIQNNPEYDAFVKIFPDGQVFTGCFAMRCKQFKQMLEQLDFTHMEKQMINIEREVANYLQRSDINTFYLKKIDLIGKAFGTGLSYEHEPITHW